MVADTLYLYIRRVQIDVFFYFLQKKMLNCFLIRERVVIFALDFPTATCESGNRSSLNKRSRAIENCKNEDFLKKILEKFADYKIIPPFASRKRLMPM